MLKLLFLISLFFIFLGKSYALTLPEAPKSVVALGGTLRYVVYLQAMDLVVGVEEVEKAGVMKGIRATGRPYNIAIREKVKGLPGIGEGGPGRLPDPEKLLALKPDLVLAPESEQVRFVKERLKIPALFVPLPGPDGWDLSNLKAVLLELGKALKREKRAKELVQEIESIERDIAKRIKGREGPTVYVGAVSMRGSHGIGSTSAGFLTFKILKAKNVADFSGKEGHLFIEREQLLSWDPEYIFIDAAGLPIVLEDIKKHLNFYKSLRAFRENKVYTLFPINFYRTNPELVLSNTYFVGKVLYPDAFKDVNPVKRTREILKKFLGVDVFDELARDFPGFKRIHLEGERVYLLDAF